MSHIVFVFSLSLFLFVSLFCGLQVVSLELNRSKACHDLARRERPRLPLDAALAVLVSIHLEGRHGSRVVPLVDRRDGRRAKGAGVSLATRHRSAPKAGRHGRFAGHGGDHHLAEGSVVAEGAGSHGRRGARLVGDAHGGEGSTVKPQRCAAFLTPYKAHNFQPRAEDENGHHCAEDNHDDYQRGPHILARRKALLGEPFSEQGDELNQRIGKCPELRDDLIPRLFLVPALALLELRGSSPHRVDRLALKFVCQGSQLFQKIIELDLDVRQRR